jgi:predicted AAA+ superfamily ATPase
MFFGREQEIKAISQGLKKTNYAIVGGRRIGKSSILQRLNRLLNHGPKYRAIYVDCEEKFNHEDLFLGLFGEPLDKISAISVRQLIVKLYGQDMPARQIVFLLDEVDELLAFDAKSEPSGQLFKTFRALSLEGFCRFVFSGSRTLYRHLHDAKSPFFNFCEDIVLKPLEQKSVAEIITKPMHQLGIEMPDEEALIDRIVHLSSCHPNIAQWLCDRLLKTSTARRITMDGLEKIASDLDYCRHYIQTAWGDATPLERLISRQRMVPRLSFLNSARKWRGTVLWIRL